ncbi:FAM186A [Symbiodinium sp. CCMP2592]|nr:FAM186A [Symbiodinium sp. CCMP2592]
MAENSFAWAASKNLLRVNEVHKCEEARLVLEEKFSNRSERGSMKSMSATGEDVDGYMLEDDVPLAEETDLSHKPADATAKGKSFVMQASGSCMFGRCSPNLVLNTLGLGMCSRPSRRLTTLSRSSPASSRSWGRRLRMGVSSRT